MVSRLVLSCVRLKNLSLSFNLINLAGAPGARGHLPLRSYPGPGLTRCQLVRVSVTRAIVLLDGPVNPEGRFDIGLLRQGGYPPLPPPDSLDPIGRSPGCQKNVSQRPPGEPGRHIFDNF